tara:strand:- start:4635 stop:5177 length:543 start_codon:yes stop_codon:yes gene_type:complete
MDLKDLQIDKQWTLFLDRDGVINKKLDDDYVKNIEEFSFIKGSKEAIAVFNLLFGRIVVVTNQQGIGKGLMSKQDLKEVHDYMELELVKAGAHLDKIYYCPELAESNASCRKPNTGMAEEARKDFPEIDFKKSIMIGDSLSDMQMGKRVGMVTLFITDEEVVMKEADFQFKSLAEIAKSL